MAQEASIGKWKETEIFILDVMFKALLKEITANVDERMKTDPPKRSKAVLFFRKITTALHLSDEKLHKELDDIHFSGAGTRYDLAVEYARDNPEELERIQAVKPLLDALYTVPQILKNVDRKQSAAERLKVFVNIFVRDPDTKDVDAVLQYLKATEYGSEDFWQSVQKLPADIKEKNYLNIKAVISTFLKDNMSGYLEENPEAAAVFKV